MNAKKIISLPAALMIVLSAVPAAAFAADKPADTVRVIVENTTYTVESGASWEGLLLDTEVALSDSSDLLTVVTDALDSANVSYALASWGGIETINELSYGWMIALNDWYTAEGAAAYTVANGGLQAGDTVAVRYSLDYGPDIGGSWENNDTSLKSLSFSAGELSPAFDGATGEYTLTLSGATDITAAYEASNKNFQVRTYKNEYAPSSSAHYRTGETITVVDGDKLIIGVGDPAWPSMNYSQTETKYTVNVSSDITGDGLEAAQAVEKQISEIGEVTLDKEDVITAAQTAYLRLSDAEKKLVSNAAVLEDAVEKLAALKKAKTEATLDEIFKATAENLKTVAPDIGAEWKILGLARAGLLPEESAKTFADKLAVEVSKSSDGKLHARYSTQNSKESLTAAALGYDPAAYAGKDILSPVLDKDYTSIQGITGRIWANTVLAGLGKDAAYTDALLADQLESGAFSFDGKTEDVDITAMCITALAGQDKAGDAVEKAVEWLSSKQQADGSYGNCESTAQVIIALATAGIDPVTDPRFVKDGVSVMDGLTAYYLGNGEFAHTLGGNADSMATEQAFLAMTANKRLSEGKTAIYDLSDVTLEAYKLEEGTNPPTGKAGRIVLVLSAAAALCFLFNKKK